jgi:hypothetical protein
MDVAKNITLNSPQRRRERGGNAERKREKERRRQGDKEI